jgi:hypothetical protein
LAGLLLGGQGILSDPAVWATGTWDRYSGVGPVEGLAAKIELAREYEARYFFLPRDGSPLEIEAGLRPHVQAFTVSVDPKNVVLDMTPGKKPMTLALERLAPPDSWLVYWRHEQLADRRPDPGHEDIERWPARGSR